MIRNCFNITINTERKAVTTDIYSTNKTNYGASLSNVKSRRRILNGKEIDNNMKRGFETTDRFYTDVVDITTDDNILFNSEIYNVKIVDNPHDYADFLQIDAKKITGQPNG